MQQVVRLLGDLGERYGTEHAYHDLRSPAEAIKLLCVNYPKLQEELIQAHEHGVGYRLIQADVDLGYEDLALPLGSNDLILTPVVTGSGDGLGQVLAGVGLVAFSILTAGAGAGFLKLGLGLTSGTFTLSSAASVAIGSIGTSLILGGVAQMLSPQPVIPNLGGVGGGRIRGSGESGATDGPQSITRGTNGRQSYMFTGAANTVGVGATVPVIYGQVIAGSQLLSAEVIVSDDSDPLKRAIKDPGPNTVTVGGEKLNGLTYASGFRFRRWDKNLLKPLEANRKRTVQLEEGNIVDLADVDYKEDKRRSNYMIFFELTNGLFDYVSGPGTTLVDGYITFEVSVSAQIEGPDADVARFQVTVQGLLTKNQVYRWMQYIRYPKIDDTAEPGDIYTKVKIIDFQAASGCNLKIHHNGYEIFKSKKYWTAPISS